MLDYLRFDWRLTLLVVLFFKTGSIEVATNDGEKVNREVAEGKFQDSLGGYGQDRSKHHLPTTGVISLIFQPFILHLMRFFFVILIIVSSLTTSTGQGRAVCPPVITNGKLYGILPMVNQTVTYSEVIDGGPVSQADLFRRVRLWVAQSCHSPSDLLTLSDKETGDLVGHFSQVVVLPRSDRSAGGFYTFRYSFVVECTNRKYRVTLTQIELEESGAKPTPIETYCLKSETDLQPIYSTLDQQLKARLASLQEAVKNYKSF